MAKNSYIIGLGDLHFILSLARKYNAEINLVNVKIVKNNYTLSLLQLNRLYTQIYNLYVNFLPSYNCRDAELLKEIGDKILIQIVQAKKAK